MFMEYTEIKMNHFTIIIRRRTIIFEFKSIHFIHSLIMKPSFLWDLYYMDSLKELVERFLR